MLLRTKFIHSSSHLLNPFQLSHSARYFATRREMLSLAQEFSSQGAEVDIAIIGRITQLVGGGSAGAGVALQAARRGLSFALFERTDFSAETSSKSTKLIHGGLRYLEQAFQFDGGYADFKEKINLVSEALLERDFMLSAASFLNKPVEILVPSSQGFWELLYMKAGVNAYHTLYKIFQKDQYRTSSVKLKWPRDLRHKQIKKYFKLINDSSEWSGITITEGQMIDSRMGLLSILTALQLNRHSPSVALNYSQVTDFIRQGQKIKGIVVSTQEGQNLEIRAKHTINCTGVFADRIREKANSELKPRILGAKGTHLVLDLPFCSQGMGLIIPKTKDGRLLFALPYSGAPLKYTLLGTTDERAEIEFGIQPTQADIDYLLDEFSQYVNEETAAKLKSSVVSAWTGLRPLVLQKPLAPGAQVSSKDITRNHVVQIDNLSGLVSLMGGKWTTYRQMGQDAVRAVFNKESQDLPNIHLRGSFDSEEERGRVFQELEEKFEGVPDAHRKIDALFQRYGIKAMEAVSEPIQLLDDQFPVLRSQVEYSIKKELAVTPEDVLERRIGVDFINREKANLLKTAVQEIIDEVNKK